MAQGAQAPRGREGLPQAAAVDVGHRRLGKLAGSYTVTVRRGPKVERQRFDELRDALAEMERRGRDLQDEATAQPVGGTLLRRIEPVHQVVARIELKGPGRLRAGVDVRGDGSSEGFTGRVRRQLLDQRPHEDAYSALWRTLG